METWFEKHHYISFIMVLVIASVIFYFSAIPASGYQPGLGILTKLYHLGIFFLLSIFLIITLVKGKMKNRQFIFLAVTLSICYAILDETHQIFVSGRISSVVDVIIDSIGIFSGAILYSIRMRIR
jgi:VanZ family protein